MRFTNIALDKRGREAFAYLAIILLTLTTFYVSYQLSMEKRWERDMRIETILSDMDQDLDSAIHMLDLDIISIHDTLMIDAETQVQGEASSLRLDHVLEGLLIDRLELELENRMELHLPDDEEYSVQLTNWSVNSQPIIGSIDIAVPSHNNSPHSSGIPSIVKGPVITGVNTSIQYQLEVSNNEKQIDLIKDSEIVIRRRSLTDLIVRRLGRFETALEDGELAGLVEYIVGSLAQMKCTMGYGREPGEGEISPISLLSNKEILSSLDLALLLISQAHFRATDEQLLSEIEMGYRDAPGSGGDVPLGEILRNTTTSMDPAMVSLIAEGIFHEDNPPSLEVMLRPMFYSIVDLIVNRLVSYLGMDESLLIKAGGLKAIFDLGVEAANSISTSILGEEIIEAGQETARSMFEGMIKRSTYLDPNGDNIFIGSKEDVIWNGTPVDGYPKIKIPDMQRTYEIGLSDGNDEDMFYKAENGTIHPRSEYYDPTEEFYGIRCNIYEVSANYSFDPIEPPFSSRDMLDDPDFISSLTLFLGAESEDDESIDKELMEKGRYAIRKVTNKLFDALTANGNSEWVDMWVGWNSTFPPALSSDIPPLETLVDFQVEPLFGLATSFASSLINELDALDFISTLAGVEEGYQDLISDWISVNYDRWVQSEQQMESCTNNRTDILVENCSVESVNIILLERDVIHTGLHFFPGKENMTFFEDYPEISIFVGLGLAPAFQIDSELLSYWSNGVQTSYSEVKEREFNDGGNGLPIGWIRNELNGPPHRGFELTFSSYDGDSWKLTEEIERLLVRGLEEIGGAFNRDVNQTGGRFLVPPPPTNECLKVQMGSRNDKELLLDQRIRIQRSPTFSVSISSVGGRYNTDPLNGTPPYSTDYKIKLDGEISVIYGVSTLSSQLSKNSTRTIMIHIDIPIQVRSNWKMFGVEYEEFGTFWEYALDKVLEAKDRLKVELEQIVEDILGGSMSSLREISPVIVDVIRGKDLDLFEIARVVSNITMDLSSTLRNAVKSIITRIIEMGIRGILNATCNLLGIDEIELDLEIGAYQLSIHSDRNALMGSNGNLLNITMDILPIGMHCFMSFNRVKNGSFDFNGTVTFDIGPLFIKLELDPFMLRAQHMISIGVRFETKKGPVIRASFDIPSLEEFKSCQVSIGDTLGMEPFIPIPPLGIQAVIDAGFRMKYRMPEELEPHINEVNITRFNITGIEIFNPRGYILYGSTLEMEDPVKGPIAAWRLEPENTRFNMVGINGSNLWKWDRDIPADGVVRVVLRSPSGIVVDDLVADLSQSGWFSRDRDGFGVWRYGEGSPGYQNGGNLPVKIKPLLISIALTSIKEAWDISYETYGLSFDIIVPFLEMAIDLFMERFLSVIRELVIDVRMFLSIEIEDASGSAGAGMELSFQADGEAVAEFLGWIYDNIKIFVQNLADPQSAGNYRTFPWEILSRCYIGLDVFMEMEMPGPVANMAPEGVDLPDSFMLAITAKVNLAIPLKLMGKDVGGGYISLGVYVMDAPDAIVSLFYDIGNIGLQQDFYLLKAAIWEESIEVLD